MFVYKRTLVTAGRLLPVKKEVTLSFHFIK